MRPINDAAPIVVLAFWLGIAVMAMAAIMLVVTLVMRRLALRRDAIHARAVARWRPFVMAPPGGLPGPVPALGERELSGFIQVWNEAHELLRGGTTAELARLARDVGLEAVLLRSLEATSFHDRVVAVVALGHVRSVGSYARLAPYADDRSPIMSLCAARALMQIDAASAVPYLVSRIVQRSDWSQGSIAAILQESAEADVAAPLAAAVQQADAQGAPRLLRFLAGVSPATAGPLIRAQLRHSADEHMLSTCLQIIRNPEDLDAVRPLLTHPLWHLRMQAAVTVGRLGSAGDEQLLIGMLSDRQWWVRYRAARALLNLRLFGADRLRALQLTLADAFARDIIRHVLAEAALGEVT